MKVHAAAVCFDINGTRLVGPVSFAADPGSRLAIVGPNGAGKSTLLRLLAGELRPTAGSITYDTVDATHLSISDLATRRAVLGQHQAEDVAFTVEQVVAMGRYAHRANPSIGRAEHQHSVASALDAVDLGGLGGRSVSSLSSGERQLISIARAFARGPELIILDEATSYIDSLTEDVIQDALSKLMMGRTGLVIAHRLSTVRHAHKIVVIDKGGILEMGNHDTLMEQRGSYFRMNHLQHCLGESC